VSISYLRDWKKCPWRRQVQLGVPVEKLEGGSSRKSQEDRKGKGKEDFEGGQL